MKMKRVISIALFAGLPWMAMSQNQTDSIPKDILPFENPNYSLLQHKQKAEGKSVNNVHVGKRPDHWNNGIMKCFRPTFNQSGGSCGSAAAISYQFGHEMNAFRNLDGSLMENKYPSHFTWLTTYSHSDKRQVARHVGVPTAAVYGGDTYSRLFGSQDYHDSDYGWMQGYEKWYSAMFNRLQNAYSFPISVESEEGREALKYWLWNHNGDMDFVAGGIANVGAASGLTQSEIPSTTINKSIGVSGMKYISVWGATYDHSLSIVGYDDRIEFDLDGNGVYGEKDKDELGAWIIANSWGNGWANKGFIYCPYKYGGPYLPRADKSKDYFKPVVYFIRKNYRPLRTFKILMDYSMRSEIALQGGISSDINATKPEQIVEFEHFRYAGNNDDNAPDAEMPMLGRWADGLHYEPMEFGYDLTDLSANFDRTKPLKYFFIVESKKNAKGKGHIYKCSFMDYELTPDGLEMPFDIDTVTIKSGETTMISIVVPGEDVAKPGNLRIDNSNLTWTAPAKSSLKLQRYYIYDGDRLTDSTKADCTQYALPKGTAHTYSVAAKYETGTNFVVSERSQPVTDNGEEEYDKDNQVYQFKNGFFVMPDVFTQSYPEATIEFWIKMPSAAAFDVGGWDGFAFQTNSSNSITFGWDKNSGNYLNAMTLAKSSWQHVAIVVKNNEMSLYINGSGNKKVTSNTYSGLMALGDLNFGNLGKTLNCSVDEVRIWKTARTQREVMLNMRMPFANPTAWQDLLAYYKMDVIEEDGVRKFRDCARGHHALIMNDEGKNVIDNTFLKQKRDPIATFTCSEGPFYPEKSIKVKSDAHLNTTSWNWNVPAIGIKDLHSQSADLIFTAPGEYPVSLTVSSIDGNTATHTDTIIVEAAPTPVADFDITETTLPTGDHFSFINRSTGDGSVYTWNIPGADAETVNSTNATAVFNAAGTYDVTLTAANASGKSSKTKQVTVTATAPKADFIINNSVLLKNTKAYLVDRSRYQPTRWTWTVSHRSEHTAITGQNSSYTPTRPGYYDVLLTASNETGSNTKTTSKALVVMNADPENGLYFNGDGYKMTFEEPFGAATKTFTLDWWMNPASVKGAFTLDCGGQLKITVNEDGSMEMANASGRSIKSGEGFVIADEWHHYAVSYSTGRVTYYRDAVRNTTGTSSIGIGNLTFSEPFVMGSDTEGMKTLVDEFRIWNKVLPQNTIQGYANQPIENVDSAATVDNLVLYYDFNQNGGDVTDRLAGRHNGKRTGFGPDGDAWPLAAGAFTLDFDEYKEAEDVSEQYLTNYKRNFYHENSGINSKYNITYALETGTDRSTWVMENEVVTDTVTTAFHIERSTGMLCLKTSLNSFADTLYNHKLYQTVVLPAGIYHFGVDMLRTILQNGTIHLMAVEGEGLPSLADVSKSLGNVSLIDGEDVTFVLTEETEVSLGLLANAKGSNNIAINMLYLKYEPIKVQEADGLVSLAEAVAQGAENYVRPIHGGVRIVTDDARRIVIHDALGRTVFDEVMSGTNRVALPKGIYIVADTKVEVK